MEIAIYSGHHGLPWSGGATNPQFMFDPAKLEGWKCPNKELSGGQEGESPATMHWMMPVLSAIFNLNIPGIMAHVSMEFDREKKVVRAAHRVWIQISSNPMTWVNDLPIVFDEAGRPLVAHVWGGDNGTHSPYEWVLDGERKVPEAAKTTEFWTEFFLGKLRSVKKSAAEELLGAQKTVDILSGIPD